MENYTGVIIEVFYPKYLIKNFDNYKEIDSIGFKIDLENGESISFIKSRDDKYGQFYKGDMVNVSVLKNKYSRGEYLTKLRDFIDVNYGYLSSFEKQKKYETMSLFNTLEEYDIDFI